MGKIRATDDERLAAELWGDAKDWDAGRQQYVPTEAKPTDAAEEPPAAPLKRAAKKAAAKQDATEE